MEKNDHLWFFVKFAVWVRIDTEFSVEFNGQIASLAPKPSYGQSVHSSMFPYMLCIIQYGYD